MNDYPDWVWRTLISRKENLRPPDQLALLTQLAESLETGKTNIFGAQIPPSAMAGVVDLVPRIHAEVEALESRGVRLRRPKKMEPLWTSRSRSEESALSKRLDDLPRNADALGPYVRIQHVVIGGFRAAGFAPTDEHILVWSTQGRGVFCGETGERLGRARQTRTHPRWPPFVSAIAPMKGEAPLMGRELGKALPTTTAEWQLGVLPFTGEVWLCPTGMPLDQPGPGAFVLDGPGARRGLGWMRAAGFSSSGRTLLLGDNEALHILSLQER